jgi:hypothetical protein
MKCKFKTKQKKCCFDCKTFYEKDNPCNMTGKKKCSCCEGDERHNCFKPIPGIDMSFIRKITAWQWLCFVACTVYVGLCVFAVMVLVP